jgi:hypothetical protein
MLPGRKSLGQGAESSDGPILRDIADQLAGAVLKAVESINF